MNLLDRLKIWAGWIPAAVLSPMHGTDVSHWQGPINFGKMRSAGVEFTIIKATEATNHIDTRLALNAAAARQAGIRRSFYHYMRPGQGAAQARHMLDTLASLVGEYGDFPIALDVEEVVTSTDVRAFAETIKGALGYWPLIYTSVGMWARVTGDKAWASVCPLWVASWGTTNPSLPAPWKSYAIHQYTSGGNGPNYGATSGSIDLNTGMREWFLSFDNGDEQMQAQIDALKAQVAGLTNEIAGLKQAVLYDPATRTSRFITDLHHRILANKEGVAGLNQRLTVTQASVIAIDNISKTQAASIKALEATAVSQGQSINKLSGDLSALPGRLSVVQEFKLKAN